MAATTQQPQMGLTFEQVWSALMEDREQQRKTEEAVNRMAANIDKMSARVDRVTANVGGLNRSMGELIETLIAAKLWEKFDAYPYNFRRAYQRMPIFDETNRIHTDIDIMLTNGDYVMAVEVKASLHRKDDVDDHLKRMELILKYPPTDCKGKILLGALAGGIVQPEIRDRAHQAGLFVLELTGESVQLVPAPQEFEPRQW